ncbi:hypothetical protein [Arthrobacter sp. NPDC056727]|uniref:hypothetical protein n=1 Tax=Arthrobacter sp. NPDC056727 TaxID=3345927 RepID=UPI003672253F
MIPSHQQLIGTLAHAEPQFLAGRFATGFIKAAGVEGEAGSFRYFPGGYWDVTLDGGTRFLSAPWGVRTELESGEVEEASGRGPIPPGGLPGPSCCHGTRRSWAGNMTTGRWDASRPILEEPGTLSVALMSLEDPSCTGTLTVSTGTYTISKVDLRYMVQILAVARTELNAEDLKVLDVIRSRVRKPPNV